MDNLDNQTPLHTDTKGLQAQLVSLQHVVVSVLILVVVLSGTFNIYLLRRWVWAKRDFKTFSTQTAQTIDDYNKQSAPLMQDFVKKLTEYGRTHPDFAPILTKYNLKPAPATSSTPVAPSVARPTSTAPKK